MLNDWSHRVRAILKNIARAILKKYCPPHKARGIHDFILATKSSVWIIMSDINRHSSFSNHVISANESKYVFNFQTIPVHELNLTKPQMID